MSARTPTLAELLNALRAGVMRDLRVALPGRVESFDAATCMADVQPMVKETTKNDDGTTSQTSLPVLTGVPVMFPGGGGLRITFPMAAGDFVWVHFADRSIDAFLDQGTEAGPDDQRRHALSDAVCYPGVRPTNSAWTNVEAGVVTIGQDSASASDFVALAAKVKSEISALRDTVNTGFSALSGHTHPLDTVTGTTSNAIVGVPCTIVPGGIIGPTGAGPSLTGPAAVGDVKSETVKVRG